MAPEPVLFNFLVPGRDEKPFYGACLLMYRPASEAMPIDDDDVEVRAVLCFRPLEGPRPIHSRMPRVLLPDPKSQLGVKAASEPSSPILNVDLTASMSQVGEEERQQQAAASAKGGPPSLFRRSVG